MATAISKHATMHDLKFLESRFIHQTSRPTPPRIQNPESIQPMNILKTLKHLIAILALAAIFAPMARATTVADTFNDIITNSTVTTWGAITTDAGNTAAELYSANGPTAGGSGFLANYAQASSVVCYVTNDLVTNLVNYVSGESNSVRHWAVGAVTNTSGWAPRTQTRVTPTMSGTIWFSFEVALNDTNGAAALVFNPYVNAGGAYGYSYTVNGTGPSAAAPGLAIRIGGRSWTNGTAGGWYQGTITNGVQGALGIDAFQNYTSPAGVGAAGDVGLTNITVNGSNGVMTASHFVPMNGQASLILGRIYTDPNTGVQAVDVWYNPDVSSQASLPAPTLTFVDTNRLFVPSSVNSIGYEVCRDPNPGVRNEIIDNVKVSDEANGFNIVYLNVAPPGNLVSVAVANPFGSASTPSPSNIVFNVESSQVVSGSPLVVSYTLSGDATEGTDYSDALGGTVTIPVGQTNALVTIVPISASQPEGNLSVVLTVQPGTGYSFGNIITGTGFILASNTANVSVQYMFTGTMAPQIWDTNLLASSASAPVLGNQAMTARYYVSKNDSYIAAENFLTNDESDAVANNDYVSVTLAPLVGRSMTLTNLNFDADYADWLFLNTNPNGGTVFLRSSLDNFTTDLGSWSLPTDFNPSPGAFQNCNVNLGSNFANQSGNVEFRIYFMTGSPSTNALVGVFLDNLYVSGTTIANPGVPQLTVAATTANAYEPSTPGQFTITRTGSTSGSLTVYYSTSGTAANGVDYASLPGVTNIAAGQNSVVVSVMPLGSYYTNGGSVTAVLTLLNNANYGIRTPSSDTVTISDGGELPPGELLTYGFNENPNTAPSLSAAAKATVNAGYSNAVTAINATAGSGLQVFGASGGAGVGHGYASSQYVSAPSTLYVNGTTVIGTNESMSVASNSYVSFVIQPQAGYQLTVTNISAWIKSTGATNGDIDGYFLRSSLDNFTSDLASLTNNVDTTNSDPFTLWNIPVNLANYPGPVEFRIYFYVPVWIFGYADTLRLDDVTFYGNTSVNPAGNQVVAVTASTPNASESGTPGAFTLARFGDSTGPLTFNYALSGTATNGVDYVFLTGTTNFAAGVTSIIIPVTPKGNTLTQPTVTVTLTALTDPGMPNSATITITNGTAVNTNQPVLTSPALVNGSVTFNFTGSAGDTTASFHVASASTVNGPYVDDGTAIITENNGVFQVVIAPNGPTRFYRVHR